MKEILIYWIFSLVRFFYNLLNRLLDVILGHTFSEGSRQERLMARDFENSAHMVKVVWRAKPSISSWTKEKHFLYCHDNYVNPKIILEKTNITLMAVERDFAVFCVTNPSIDIYDTQTYPFTNIPQFPKAEKLIILPNESLHRLAVELGDPKVPVGVVNMTARCGSTLLAQVFNRVSGTRAMSEPWGSHMVTELRAKQLITPKESKKLLQSAVRIQLKIEPGSGVERIFWKLSPSHAPLLKDFMTLFPDFCYMFNTRHPMPSARSLNHVLNVALSGPYIWFGYLWRDLTVASNFFCSFEPKHEHLTSKYNKWLRYMGNDEISIQCYTGVLSSYFDNREVYKRVILYENLMDDPERELRKIFDIMDIDTKHIESSLSALHRDSQNAQFVPEGAGRTANVPPSLHLLFAEYVSALGIKEIKFDMTVPEFKKSFGF